MRPNHMIYKHKQNERQQRAEVKQERIKRLAELEKQYETALANSQNSELVAQYNHFIAVKKEYEGLPEEYNSHFDVAKAIQEVSKVISEFRIQHVGVDKRDLTSLKTQLNILRSIVPQENSQSEPGM